MAGSVDETHYAEVWDEYSSDQSLLQDFSDDGSPTTIAVVSLPRQTGIDEACDEWMPELGMPKQYLREYWQYKDGYETNSAIENPERRAWRDAQLDRRYRAHLRNSDEAQAALSSIVSRLNDGEDVTLVCYEESPERCHRSILVEKIEARIDSKFELTL